MTNHGLQTSLEIWVLLLPAGIQPQDGLLGVLDSPFGGIGVQLLRLVDGLRDSLSLLVQASEMVRREHVPLFRRFRIPFRGLLV